MTSTLWRTSALADEIDVPRDAGSQRQAEGEGLTNDARGDGIGLRLLHGAADGLVLVPRSARP